MPSARCVVQECSNVSNLGAGISLHRSPADKTEYGKWLRFVRTHRANFNPKGVFVICSGHFREECFDGIHMKGSRRKLQPLSIPTIWKKEPQKPLSERSRRKVINEILSGNAESSQNSTSFGNENYANRPINTP
ncbi:THAP domain-containing 2, partial [Paramuricea clavata]